MRGIVSGMGGKADQASLPPPHSNPIGSTLFIECTDTYHHSGRSTGIQRVVRNVLRYASGAAARYGYRVVPVIFERGRFVPADLAEALACKRSETASARQPTYGQKLRRRMLRGLAFLLPFAATQRFLFALPDQFGLAWCALLPMRLLGLRAWPVKLEHQPDVIDHDEFGSCTDNILLLLDASWNYRVWPAVARFRKAGGKVVGVVYDLIPITHPHTSEPAHTAAFGLWLKQLDRHTDAFIGISRTTAQQIRAAVLRLRDRSGHQLGKPVIEYFLLGSELDLIDAGSPIRLQILQMFPDGQNVFLMVGSIEPRKKHRYVLDAFDNYWAEGGSATLIILGRHGWKNEAFLEHVAQHPRLGRQLFLVRDATDSELDYAYRNASALIIASEIEGFGLPVVEALQYGLPVLCSDIPVFREIADGKATFFDLAHSRSLTNVLANFCHDNDAKQRVARRPQSWITWQQSTEQLCDAIVRALRLPTEPRRSAPEP